jgi:hypothetical protein
MLNEQQLDDAIFEQGAVIAREEWRDSGYNPMERGLTG